MNKSITLLLGLVQEGDLKLLEGDIVGVDYGVKFAYDHHLPLVAAIGDFDSVTEDQKHRLHDHYAPYWIELPINKDQTDAEIALQWAMEQGYTSIRLLGGIGGRLDHFYTLLNLLYQHAGQPIHILSATHHIMCLIPGVYELPPTHDYFSLFPREDAVISIQDAAYDLHEKTLSNKDNLGVSNAWKDGKNVRLKITKGVVLLFLTKD